MHQEKLENPYLPVKNVTASGALRKNKTLDFLTKIMNIAFIKMA